MNNQILQIKVKERLNKLDSADYDNIQCWQIIEAFNKAQVEWCRRQLHGSNIFREGDEQSTSRIDDLEILITSGLPISLTNRIKFYDTALPVDYMRFKRVSCYATSDCCPDPRPMVVYLAESGNLDELLRDKIKQPSFEWSETFCTFSGGKLNIYTNGEFNIVNATLSYYRQPKKIQVAGCVDPYTQLTPTVDIPSELKDDVIELIIDDTVSILAGDIESQNQYQREDQQPEQNN